MSWHVFRQHPGALPTSAVRWLLRSGAALILGMSGLLLAGLVSIGDHVSASCPSPQTTDERKASEPSTLSGRVIEKDGGKPVAGAAVTIAWSDAMAGWTGPDGEIPPPVLGENTTRTDGDGRYRLTVPPERIADRPIGNVVVRVGHPDFVPRRWDVGGVYRLWNRDKAIPDTVALQRGVEYHAQVVRGDGKPAAGVPYEFSNWISEGNAELKGRTDAGGRIRLRMPKASALAISIPRGDDTAPFEKFWGVDHRPTRPEDYAPADLGVIRLGPGLTLMGRVLDLAGKPIGGQPLMLTGRSQPRPAGRRHRRRRPFPLHPAPARQLRDPGRGTGRALHRLPRAAAEPRPEPGDPADRCLPEGGRGAGSRRVARGRDGPDPGPDRGGPRGVTARVLSPKQPRGDGATTRSTRSASR